MRGTDSSSAGNKYEPELVDFPGLLPATAPPRPSFPDEPKFLDSLPDVSRFLCLMFPDFFAWCFLICLPNVSRLLDVPCFFLWCILISWPDVSRFPCLIFTNVFAEYHSSFSPHGPLDFLRPGSFYNSNSLIWVRDFHLKIFFYPVFSPPTSSFDILSK